MGSPCPLPTLFAPSTRCSFTRRRFFPSASPPARPAHVSVPLRAVLPPRRPHVGRSGLSLRSTPPHRLCRALPFLTSLPSRWPLVESPLTLRCIPLGASTPRLCPSLPALLAGYSSASLCCILLHTGIAVSLAVLPVVAFSLESSYFGGYFTMLISLLSLRPCILHHFRYFYAS